MIRLTILACSFTLAAALVHAGESAGSDEPAPRRGSAATETRVLGVEELMKDVDHHRGEIRVEGIVSAVSTKTKTLALIDVKEFKQCGVVTCAEYTLPVRWAGGMPTVKDQVRIEGKVEETDGKLVFVATQVSGAKDGKDEKK